MIDELLKQFKNNTCANCKATCDKGINISYFNNKLLLKCCDYKQYPDDNSYEVSYYKEIKL